MVLSVCEGDDSIQLKGKRDTGNFFQDYAHGTLIR